jgi:hypothetical protein
MWCTERRIDLVLDIFTLDQLLCGVQINVVCVFSDCVSIGNLVCVCVFVFVCGGNGFHSDLCCLTCLLAGWQVGRLSIRRLLST